MSARSSPYLCQRRTRPVQHGRRASSVAYEHVTAMSSLHWAVSCQKLFQDGQGWTARTLRVWPGRKLPGTEKVSKVLPGYGSTRNPVGILWSPFQPFRLWHLAWHEPSSRTYNSAPLYHIHFIDSMSITDNFHRHNQFRQRNLQLQPGNVVFNKHKCACTHVIGMTSWDSSGVRRAHALGSMRLLAACTRHGS